MGGHHRDSERTPLRDPQRTLQCDGQDGRFGNGVFSLFEDRGTLWVGATTGLWRWAPGDPTRYATPTSSVPTCSELSDGPLLLSR